MPTQAQSHDVIGEVKDWPDGITDADYAKLGQTSTIACCPDLRFGSVGSKEANCSKIILGHRLKMSMRTSGVC